MVDRSKARSVGVVSAVPCPWCNYSNDLRDLAIEPEKGARIICDNPNCKKVSTICAVDNRPRIILEQWHGR